MEVFTKHISRADAIRIFNAATDKDDPFWERQVEQFLDNPDDYDAPLPSVEDVFAALGVSRSEYIAATSPDK